MKDDEFAADLGRRLTDLREKSGLSAEAFGKAGGVSRTAQFAYERGERLPDALYLARVARACAVTLHWMLTGRHTDETPDLSEGERALIDRLRDMPGHVRRTVEDMALLAWLAADSRRDYHAADAAAPPPYPAPVPAPPLTLHEPSPGRHLPRKGGHHA